MALYRIGIRIYALFNPKAKKWLVGRKNWRNSVLSSLKSNEQRIWVHAASLGEFEQGRPVIEKIKQQYPGYKIVLTFFSPSGYEVRKNYELADYVFYLPMDSKKNASDFIHLINPSLAVFIKYEFWYYYLAALEKQQIPIVLISAAFRKGQAFFKWYGSLFRKVLQKFSYLFVQDSGSKQLLNGIGLSGNVIVSGDTRYDRVAEIAKKHSRTPSIEAFKGNDKLIIAGSTWPEDEKILRHCYTHLPPGWKLIIAPHEIDTVHINEIAGLFKGNAVLFSGIEKQGTYENKVLIIDNIGMLSSIYAYSNIAYIGRGFEKGGIHNILEPAVFGMPVLFGPAYEKFTEAREMVNAGLAFPVKDAKGCNAKLSELTDDGLRAKLHSDIIQFMKSKTGATDSIIRVLAAQSLIR